MQWICQADTGGGCKCKVLLVLIKRSSGKSKTWPKFIVKKKTGKESIKQQTGFWRQWRKYVSQTSKLIQNQKRKHGIKGLVTSDSYRCVHFHLWLTSSDLMVNVSSRSESGRSCKIPWWCWTVSPSCCHLQLTWLTGSHRILFQLIQLKF